MPFSEPKTLLLDTTSDYCSVAIANSSSIVESIVSSVRRNHSADLLPFIHSLFEKCSLSYDSLDYISCLLGPGSLIGIRSGLSVVQGIQLVKENIKVLGIGNLELAAYMIYKTSSVVSEYVVQIHNNNSSNYIQTFNENILPIDQVRIEKKEMGDCINAEKLTQYEEKMQNFIDYLIFKIKNGKQENGSFICSPPTDVMCKDGRSFPAYYGPEFVLFCRVEPCSKVVVVGGCRMTKRLVNTKK